MVPGGGGFGRSLGLDEVMIMKPPTMGSVPYKKRKRPEPSLAVCHVKTVRRQPSASQEEGSTGNLHLALGRPASGAVRKYISVVEATRSVLLCYGSLSKLLTDFVLFLINFLFCQAECLAWFLAHGAQM